ncbi:MAG: ABC transporter permease [Idiomarina sp.]|nr:ABC transporter permease [Idiomarina sp.]
MLTRLFDAFGFTGRQILRLPAYLFELLLFTLRALNPRQQGHFRFNQATYRTLLGQLIFSGIDALPVVTLLALASGLAITTQVILTIQMIGERAEVIDILVRVIIFELSTLLTAILLIGRSGSAITVDLGNMKLNRELEGLEMLGINLNHFLVTPRVIGTGLAQAILAIYFAVIAIISGVIMLSYTEHAGYLSYLPEIATSIHPYDLIVFVVKNLVFGILIGAIASYHALRVGQSRTELPQQTQQAIVNSLSIIFVLNALFILLLQPSLI